MSLSNTDIKNPDIYCSNAKQQINLLFELASENYGISNGLVLGLSMSNGLEQY
jgi:hypothetical protein